ncbi:tsukushi-like [Oratosquilla oratoria]|uniref:tsukushi-like n=1 Tax=Oratosquilla oratoria TaxID=337810 RepID=UPI003F762EBF
MRTCLLLTVALTLALGPTPAPALKEGQAKSICSICECLNSSPYLVDCKTLGMEQIPLDSLARHHVWARWILMMDDNRVGHLPQLPLMPNLTVFTMRHNGLSSMDEATFMNLPSLKKVDLSYNNLSYISLNRNIFKGRYNNSHPDPIGIEELDISHNLIGSIDHHLMQHLPVLKKLALHHNPILDMTIEMIRSIADLENLEELDLSFTQLHRLPQHFLVSLRSMKVLRLTGNHFTTVDPEIKFARSLQELHFDINPITTIRKGDFDGSRQKQLSKIFLTEMPELRNVAAYAFSELSSLEELHLARNPKLNVIDPDAFAGFEDDKGLALKKIDLSENSLQHLSRDMLPWESIEYVDIQHNPWDCDCHFKWVATDLIPSITKKNPSKAISIVCAGPELVAGRNVASLLQENHAFQCYLVPYSRQKSFYGPLLVGIIVAGCLVLFTGTALFAYVLYRSSQERNGFGDTVKYRRQRNHEEDTEGASYVANVAASL